MAKKMIVKNDPTTHGGYVMTAWGEDAPWPFKIDGKPVACVGDRVYCPKKGHSNSVILEGCGDPYVKHCGKEIAYEGCLCSCGCRLMSAGQSLATYSSNSEPPHPVVVLIQERKAREAAAAAATMAAASGAGSDKERESFAEYFVLLDQVTAEPLPDFAWVTRCEGDEQLDITGEDGFTQEAGADGQKSVELLAAIQLKPVIR